MTASPRYESIQVGDDHFDAFCSLPASGTGPGVLLFQEIFGINDNMRTLAGRLSDAGYVVLVPDMFWRIERRFESKDESRMAEAMEIVQKLDFDKAVEDIVAAHAHLLHMDECSGKVAAMGFCLGGGLAFAAATGSRVDGHGIDAAVCYYGSAINSMLSQVSRLECPALFHYGQHDPYIPPASIDEVETAVSGRPGVEFYRYDAGHAFSNEDAPSFYDPEAAAQAWPRTLDFLARHVPA